MCGLVGVAGKLDYTHKKILEELLLMSELRGWDSTGIATLGDDCTVDIKKKPCPAYEFLQWQDVQKFMDKNVHDARVVIGHTRAATTKRINLETSHPFQYGHIVLAHNGTLTTKGGLKDWGDGRIDSQEIAFNMQTHGEKETLEQLHGAFALTWINMNELTFNIARNDERPMYFCFSDNGSVMYWASEAWMLRGILARNSKKIDDDKVWCLDSLSWCKFDVTGTDWRKYSGTKFTEWSFPVRTLANRQTHTPSTQGWAEGSSTDLKKARIRGVTPDKQKEILAAMGLNTVDSEPMAFMNFQTNPLDSSRCTITGNIVAYPGGGNKNPVTVNAIIYASSKRVFDAVGQGRYAEIKIDGVHKDMIDESWVIVCRFIRPYSDKQADEKLSAQRQDDGPGYDDDVSWDMTMPLIFPNPKKRGQVPPNFRYGYKDEIVTDLFWARSTERGCYACEEVPMPMEHKSLIWIDADHFICENCAIKHNKELALPIADLVKFELVV